MTAARRGISVMGVGNIVLSDDGLGVHAVRRLGELYDFGDDVELVEGGTAGLLLLPRLADARRAIIVDAIDTGSPAGAIVRIEGEDHGDFFPAGSTPHQVGLRDLLGAARLTEAWPERLVLHGAQPASTAIGAELTPPLAAILDRLVERVVDELTAWGASPLGAPSRVAAS